MLRTVECTGHPLIADMSAPRVCRMCRCLRRVFHRCIELACRHAPEEEETDDTQTQAIAPTTSNDLEEKYEDDYDDEAYDEDYLYDFDDDTTAGVTAIASNGPAAPRTATKGNALLLWSVIHGSYPRGGEISDRVEHDTTV